VNYKDPKMIPVKRLVEMEDHLYLLHFTVENVEQVEAKPDGDKGKGDGSDGEGDEDEDLLDEEPEKEQETEEEKEKSEGYKSREQGSGKEKEREGEKQTPKTRQKQGEKLTLQEGHFGCLMRRERRVYWKRDMAYLTVSTSSRQWS
jgi:hypothetical protein